MIRRLLIANRGEIACRIARTARRMGIETVGVYSAPDANALHTDAVDRAIALGGATPSESYLRTDAVLAAAVDAGCDAIHPGYGFLAENATFARMVEEAGIVWVGPTPDQIALLGDKVAAKRAAIEAGVPTAPSFVEIPDDLAMPVLVKAAAGGGGRGMRVVRDRSDLEEALEAAAREAESAFGDGAVFVEPYIEHGRHVEVQIIGDAHGTVLHFGERECSIQRRNQKIIEETPSPGIDEATRRTLWDSALALARAVGYRSAGTVEFLVGEDGSLNFLEVNTRLQVEHPVTEAVTGLDLVELQLRVAAGEPLGLAQGDIEFTGHAIEARLVAEDPVAGWVPSAGEIAAFDIDDSVRVDTGVRAGSTISPDYDSMIAKVIAHGATRTEAAANLRHALRAAHLAGPATNRDTLVAIMGEPDFLAGNTATSYLAGHPAVTSASGVDDPVPLLVAVAAKRMADNRSADRNWGFAPPGWRNLATTGHRSTWRDRGGADHQIEELWVTEREGTVLPGPWPVAGDDGVLGPDERRRASVRVLSKGGDRVAVEVDGVRHLVQLTGHPLAGVTATSRSGSATFTLLPAFVDHDADEAGSGPVCPLPGTVIAVHVEVGQSVSDGELLMVVEAMKMEHRITAIGAATVVDVPFRVGDRVDTGDLLIRLEHPE